MPTPKRANPRRVTRSKVATTKVVPVVLSSDDEDQFAEREPLFSIDGTEYTIPVRVSPTHTLRYLDIWSQAGVGIALIYALKDSLGADGYRVLTECALTQEHLDLIVSIVRGKYDGTGPKASR